MIDQIIARLNEELHDVAELGENFWKALRQLHVARAFGILRDLIEGVVVAVEEISSQLAGVSGEQKKRAVVQWLNSKIDIKFMPEWLERELIETAVDYIVGRLNHEYGKRGWFMHGIQRGRTLFGYVKISIQL